MCYNLAEDVKLSAHRRHLTTYLFYFLLFFNFFVCLFVLFLFYFVFVFPMLFYCFVFQGQVLAFKFGCVL
jgi:hypothetical protein